MADVVGKKELFGESQEDQGTSPQGYNTTRNTGADGVVGQGSTQGTGTSSGNWTNLQQYKQANPNAATDMAKRVGQDIYQQGQEIQSGVQEADKKYDQSVTDAFNRSSYRQAHLPQLAGENWRDYVASWNKGGYGDITQQTQAPDAFSAPESQQNLSQWETRANEASSPTGLRSEVGRMYDGQSTSGMKDLDQYLLQTSPEAQSIVGGYKNQSLENYKNQITNPNAAMMEKLNTYIGNEKYDPQIYQNIIDDAQKYTNMYNDMGGEMQTKQFYDANLERQAHANALSELMNLGYTPQALDKYYTADADKLASEENQRQALEAEAVAEAQAAQAERDRLAAEDERLSRLGETYKSIFGDEDANLISNAEEPGVFDPDSMGESGSGKTINGQRVYTNRR